LIKMLNDLIRGTTVADRFPGGEATSVWYYNWLRKHEGDLDRGNMTTIEAQRQKWCTSANLETHFDIWKDVMISTGIGRENPDYDPELEGSPALFVVRPERVGSLDESSFDMDQTDGRKDRGNTTTRPKGSRGEVMVNKGGGRITMIGGSLASGDSFPPLCIWPWESGLDIECLNGTPKSTQGFEGTHHHNATGGATETDDTVLRFMKANVVPHFRPTKEDPMIIGMDGHGSHITIGLLRFCLDNGIHIVLRPPHTSSITQGEDLVNFREVKPAFRQKKCMILGGKALRGQGASLGFTDMMECIHDPWVNAFDRRHNVESWEKMGLNPFTRKPYWKVVKAERQRRPPWKFQTLIFQ
jgi:hypothetical protein